jgi:hypothetical protein
MTVTRQRSLTYTAAVRVRKVRQVSRPEAVHISHLIRPAREELAGMRIPTAGPRIAAAVLTAQDLAR